MSKMMRAYPGPSKQNYMDFFPIPRGRFERDRPTQEGSASDRGNLHWASSNRDEGSAATGRDTVRYSGFLS